LAPGCSVGDAPSECCAASSALGSVPLSGSVPSQPSGVDWPSGTCARCPLGVRGAHRGERGSLAFPAARRDLHLSALAGGLVFADASSRPAQLVRAGGYAPHGLGLSLEDTSEPSAGRSPSTAPLGPTLPKERGAGGADARSDLFDVQFSSGLLTRPIARCARARRRVVWRPRSPTAVSWWTHPEGCTRTAHTGEGVASRAAVVGHGGPPWPSRLQLAPAVDRCTLLSERLEPGRTPLLGFVSKMPLRRLPACASTPIPSRPVRARPASSGRCHPVSPGGSLTVRDGFARRLRPRDATPGARSALAVSHGFDGFLRTRGAGLLHPAADHGVRLVAGQPTVLPIRVHEPELDPSGKGNRGCLHRWSSGRGAPRPLGRGECRWRRCRTEVRSFAMVRRWLLTATANPRVAPWDDDHRQRLSPLSPSCWRRTPDGQVRRPSGCRRRRALAEANLPSRPTFGGRSAEALFLEAGAVHRSRLLAQAL
jgi:hypothetical protein